MLKRLQVQRADLAMENRLIRLRLWVPHSSRSESTEALLQAERTGELLELLDAESHEPLGVVKVSSRAAHSLGKTNLEQWLIHFQPEDPRAHATLATLPEIHPDPY